MRCRWCPGCLEFERRRLAQRVHTHFSATEEKLWLVLIECPPHSTARVAAAVRRRRTVRWSSGFSRVSRSTVALIAAGAKPRLRACGSLSGCCVSVTAIRRSRGLRAWSNYTAGLLVTRDEWGEQTKRWYWRGLAPAEKESFDVSTRVGLVARNPGCTQGIRAVRDGVGLYPPEAWRPPRLNRRRGALERRTNGPLQISATLKALIQQALSAPLARKSPVIAGARERASSSLAVVPDGAGAPDRNRRANSNYVTGGVMQVLDYSTDAPFSEWAHRMITKARARDG